MIINAQTLKDAMLKSLIHLHNADEVNPRMRKTKELLNVQINITNPRARVAKIPKRNYNPAFNVAEFLTYVGGINSVDYISQFNDNIAQFSDNGVTFYGSYGERLRKQIPKLIEKLKNSPDTRQGVLTIYQSDDAFADTKDTPCTVALDFKIRDEKLNLHVFMRSNDLVWGFQYDMFNFTLIQEMIANSLGIDVGTYTHTATSLHIYKRHWDLFNINFDNAKSIEFKLDKDYDGVMEVVKESYKYVSGHFSISPPDDDLLEVLNNYNYRTQISNRINIYSEDHWAKELYEEDNNENN